jgi:hypothetical protein
MSFVFKYLFKKIWGKPEETVTPPADETVTPPANETVTPPADETVTPPANETVTPPANKTVTPPANKTVTPPADEAIIPPADEAVIPPADEAVIPPADETVTPPANETVTPPANEIVTPPADEATLITTEDAAILTKTDEDEALLNLFYNYNTNLDLTELLFKASEKSMLYTLKIIAHIRKNKCGGSGNFYRKTSDWLFHNHENQLIINMEIFLEKFGHWGDLSHLPSDSESYKHYIKILSNNLNADLDNVNNGPKVRSACVTKSFSSTANWVQQNKHIWPDVAKCLGINMKTLKKDYFKPLTKNSSLEDDATIEIEKSEQIIVFTLSHHDIMMSALSDPCYDDIKCIEQSLGTNA